MKIEGGYWTGGGRNVAYSSVRAEKGTSPRMNGVIIVERPDIGEMCIFSFHIILLLISGIRRIVEDRSATTNQQNHPLSGSIISLRDLLTIMMNPEQGCNVKDD